MGPEELGKIHGRYLAVLAVDLRRKGLPIETWEEYFHHRVAALARENFTEQADVDRWARALMIAYGNLIDRHLHDLALLIDQPRGRA